MGRPLPVGVNSPTCRAQDSSSDEHEHSEDDWQVYSGSESGDEDLMEEEEAISPDWELKQQLIGAAADGEESILRLLLEEESVSNVLNDAVRGYDWEEEGVKC